MRYQSLIERDSRRSALLESVCIDATPDQRLVIEGVYNHFKPLLEAELDPAQIRNVFSNVEQELTAAGKNRTIAGKAVDAGTRAQELLSTAGKWLQDTTPVKFFDQKFEELKSKISDKLGSDSNTMKSVNALGDFARNNPGKTAFVVGVLTAMASLGGGPVAGAVAGQILRGSVELLKGEKLSTAVGRGAKTGLIGYVAGLGAKGVAEMFANLEFDVNKIPGYVNLRRINLYYNVNGQTIFQFNAVIPAELQSRTKALFDASIEQIRNGDFERGTRGLARLRDILSDRDLQQVVDAALQDNSRLYASAREDIANARKVIDQLIAGVQGAAAGGTTADKKKSIPEQRHLNETQILEVFSIVEAPFGGLKGLLGKAASKVSQVGKNISTKITSDKLEKLWSKAGSPTDSAVIIKILRKGGISDDLIKKAMTDVGVSQQDVERDLGIEAGDSEVPFKSGVTAMDTEAEKIFKEKGKDAFIAYWEKVVADQRSPAADRGADPIGTVVNRNITDPKTGKQISVKLKKVGDNKWQNLNDPSSAPFTPKPEFAKSANLRETTDGSTSSGNIANIQGAIGGPMMPIIKRMPAGQSFFGPAGTARSKSKKKRSKR